MNTPEPRSPETADRSRRPWGFLLSRRWISYFVLLVIFAIACGFLSHWQFERRDERIAENRYVSENFDAPPRPLTEVLTSTDAYRTDLEWTPVEMTGEYLADEQLLARARPHNGLPGFEILTPLRTTDGEIFIVNRGWIPTGSTQDDPDHIPEPPTGTVTVTARLKPSERTVPGRTAPEGQIATIHLPSFAERLSGQTVYTGAYGLLRTESPASEHGELTAKPELTEGNHLSYAVQWIIFAVIAAIGLVYGVREEFRERNAESPAVQRAKAREQERRARRKRKTDAEVEDELLDTQSRDSAHDDRASSGSRHVNVLDNNREDSHSRVSR